MIARIFYLALGIYIGYQTGIMRPDPRNDLESMESIRSKARLALALATNDLDTCAYLFIHYPAKYLKLRWTAQTVILDFSPVDILDSCASTSRHGDRIRLYPIVYDNHSQGCYENQWNILYAHELLHAIGLPPHKSYKTEAEYMKKDPIEIVIANCYDRKKI